METFSAEAFSTILAVVGAVIIVAALISGLVERTNFPQVAIFLALGAILGAPGLGLLKIDLESPALRVVATLSLALVLFTDAVGLNVREVRQHGILALRVLGPGTMLSAALVALAAWWLLGLPLPAAIILGAALASTDPVLLRGFLRRRDVPPATRQALRLESGLNDVVLLPVVLVAMEFMGSASSHDTDWGRMILNLFVLGPGAGIAIGLLAVATLDMVRRRVGVRRDYESLYSLGVAFAAFAAAEALHGSGFLAAFAAGLTIAALDVELCDCFLEYGETTAEMALLFTFVLFGSSLIWDGLAVLTMASLAFAVLVILIRPLTFIVALVGARLTRRDKALISWFGPRGLSSLLLVLLPVFAGLPGSEALFALCCLVVLLSVVLHGGSLMFVGKGRRDTQPQLAPAIVEAAAPMPATEAIRFFPTGTHGPGDGFAFEEGSERITIEELRRLQERGERVLVLDVRTDRTYDEDNLNATGAIRLHPDDAVREAERLRLPRNVLMAAFCA
ncbi:MAG TPA: cation:proton antiporter [Chloroflexia bacterium]|nr:cation:proton antiporter [Chloroflexia bacterium]